MKRIIKFSHPYSKMRDILSNGTLPKEALLLEVFVTYTKNLKKDFLEYDTIYKDKKGQWKNYEIPKGRIMVLLLKTNGKIWTTIRKYKSRKYKLYKKGRGKPFQIVITNE